MTVGDFLIHIIYILEDCFGILKVCIRQIRTRQFFRKMNTLYNKNKKIFILANGPSLATFNKENTLEGDICTLNFSIITDIFYELKPQMHVFADSYFFYKTEEENTKVVYDAISNRIDWPITIWVPYGVPKSFKQLCSKNRNVKLSFFTTSIWQNKSKSLENLRFYMFDKGYIGPRHQNVVVSCIYCAIHQNYKEIYLYGVDHDWLRTTYVGDDNVTYFVDSHYYGDNKTYWYDGNGEKMTLDVVLLCLSRMFKSYRDLQKYAEYKGDVKIVNRTKGSFIDAFVRE